MSNPVTVETITERLCDEFQAQDVEALLRVIDEDELINDPEAIAMFRIVEDNERRRVACMEED